MQAKDRVRGESPYHSLQSHPKQAESPFQPVFWKGRKRDAREPGHPKLPLVDTKPRDQGISSGTSQSGP